MGFPFDPGNAPFNPSTCRTTNKFNSLMASHIVGSNTVRILTESVKRRALPHLGEVR